MSLISEVMRWALVQAIPENPDRLAQKAQRLIVQLAGLFVSAVTLMLAGICLLAGVVFWLLPRPVAPDEAVLVIGALLAVVGGVGWMVFANVKKIGNAIGETFHAPQRPVDIVARKANHIVRSFLEGWENGTGPNHPRW